VKLLFSKGWEGDDELVTVSPTESQISKLVHSLDWQNFNSIQLEVDDHNWINVSGNMNRDGLAISYEENGEVYVSKEAPTQISELETALKYFLNNDKRYKDFGFSSSTELSSDEIKQSQNYDLWKVKYEAQRTSERRRQIFSIIASLLIAGLLVAFFNLWFNNELRFIGHETTKTSASVVDTQWKPVRGGFIQWVIYEFEYQGETYRGSFRGTKYTGKHQIDDQILIKFATDDPTISKRISTLQRM
jgi:hypothetical protein